MSVRRNLWDPSTIDGHATDSATAPDGGILLPDHAFVFHTAAPDAAPAADDWSGVAIEVDFVDDTIQFADTARDSAVASVQDVPGETQSLTYAELSALYPGIVWPPMSEWTSSTTDGGDPRSVAPSQDDPEISAVQNVGPAGLDWRITPDFDDDPGWVPGVVTQPSTEEASRGAASPDASSQDDPEVSAVQNVGPAGLDWRITPDFDDDPGWVPGVVTQPSSNPPYALAPRETSSQVDTTIETPQAPGPAGLDWQVTPDFDDDPGWIPTSATAPRTGGSEPASSAATSGADEPPALRDETQTSSLTLAELNEQYPGIVWPANWWLL